MQEMLLYSGDGERLCHRISRSLAEITAHHHPHDIELMRAWRGLVSICVPVLSSTHLCDTASFVRLAMWEGYLAGRVPAKPNIFVDVDHAYADASCAIGEMMSICNNAEDGGGIGCRQQKEDLAELLAIIASRLQALHARGVRRRFIVLRQQEAAQKEEGMDLVRSRIPFV